MRRLLCRTSLIFAFAWSCRSHAAPAAKGATIFIGVGIASYEDKYFPDLNWPEQDVKQLADAVGKGFDIPPRKTLLLGKDARKSDLRQLLVELKSDVGKDNNVVVYISSHGSLAMDRDGELQPVVVMRDTQSKSLLSTGLTHRELRSWLNDLPARKKVLILATCHSGVGKSRLPPDVQRLVASQKGKGDVKSSFEDLSEGFMVLSASTQSETARESDSVKGDIYTHYFVQGLTQFDRNRDGRITALEAHDYAKGKTFDATDGAQRPTMEAVEIGSSDVVLAGRKSGEGVPLLEAYDKAYEYFSLALKGRKKGTESLPSSLALQPGLNEVQLMRPNSSENDRPIARIRVSVKAGETVSLSELLQPPPFGVTATLTAVSFRSNQIEKLTGSSSSFVGGVDARAVKTWDAFSLEVAAGFAEPLLRSQEEDVGEGLYSELTLRSSHLRLLGSYSPAFRQRLSLGFDVVHEYATLSMGDSANFGEDFASQRNFLVPTLSAEVNVRGRIYLAPSIAFLSGRHRFGSVGDLDVTRYLMTVGVGYALGGRGELL